MAEIANLTTVLWFDGDAEQIYGEISPRLSAGKLLDRDLSAGPVTDLYAAAQYNGGEGYEAWLFGLGCDIALPGFDFFNANFYRKKQNIGPLTWQFSAAYRTHTWEGWHFNGFVDITDYEVNTQHQLLYDVGRSWMQEGKLFAGSEWLYYRDSDADVDTSVFQAMIKYRF